MSDNEESETLRWQFYDSAKAFPHNVGRLRDGVVQEMVMSLSSSQGGTAGEFLVTWHKFANCDRPACQVNLFSDAWQVANDAGVLPLLASLGEDPTYEEVAASVTERLGAVDVTERLRISR